jgi:hypothetical protein
MHYQISRKKTPVPKRIMALFGVSTGQLVAHMLQRGKFAPTKFSQAYRMDNNRSYFIVENSVTQPVQLSLGALPSGATFTEKQGHGWNPTNVAEYFQVSSLDEDNGENKRAEDDLVKTVRVSSHLVMDHEMHQSDKGEK